MQFTTIVAATLALIAGVEAQHSFTAWSGTGFGGRTFRTGARGTYNLGFTAASYRYQGTRGDGCCAKTCMNRRETGSFCQPRQNENVAFSNRFNKVVMGCDNTVLNC
ncbi:hypothetical protein Slin15195_G031980 [Septoria linicola]|uniref:Uncharacterized protein n=1 Tax=Septoria linicola TaxID=215465 RepID=A0A9Q9AI83_9PEZI|nr:hypothetical protein Slin14017_G031000 [Septoria linicola]USW49879.1 hypothetical protein Slin15195_G031980 [Septoria linicola]